jgi:branched-chain amino acid transport system substrate-binding protein
VSGIVENAAECRTEEEGTAVIRDRERSFTLRICICVLIIACGWVTLAAAGGQAAKGEAASKPIKLGVIQPLEGECAPWGIPIVRGAEIWAEELNAQGGILCGDGKRHLIEINSYTNVCYYPNEELKAAKKAVLEDKKQYLFQTYTPACRKALVSLLNEQKVLSVSYGAGYLSKDCPYLLGDITGLPTCLMAMLAHVLDKHPDIKKVAILCTNESYGIAGQWYYAAGCEALKDKVEVVFNETIDPETKDFFPIMDTVLKTKPDVICHMGLPPGPLAIMLETAIQLGFKGYWLNETWPLAHIQNRVTNEQMEGKLFSSWAADASVPGYNKRLDQMYKTYIQRYGELEWIVDASATYVALCTLEPALLASKSVEPSEVIKALYLLGEVDHPIFGKSIWGGKEVFGVNHHLLTAVPIYVVSGGKQTLSGIFDYGPWWEKNKAAIVPVLKKGGQTNE